ncbi:MAG: hypothetical protein KDC23_00730 [Actinobacteria bacterium]|nr:hypothetical protein [Actinomycetota bacterium]
MTGNEHDSAQVTSLLAAGTTSGAGYWATQGWLEGGTIRTKSMPVVCFRDDLPCVVTDGILLSLNPSDHDYCLWHPDVEVAGPVEPEAERDAAERWLEYELAERRECQVRSGPSLRVVKGAGE